MLYTTKQHPFGADPIVIFGQFPEKGAKKAKGQGYVLYHRDTFLGDFNEKIRPTNSESNFQNVWKHSEF